MSKKFQDLTRNKILNYYQLNKFYYKVSKKILSIQKIIICFDQKSTDYKQVAATHLALEILFYRHGVSTGVNKSNLLFKTKKGQPIGCKITINNKINIVNTFALINDIYFYYEENNLFLHNNKNKLNTITFSISEIYNYKKLENFYLLFNKLKNLNISLVTASTNNKNNYIKFITHIIFQNN